MPVTNVLVMGYRMRNKTELEQRWRSIYEGYLETLPRAKAQYLDPIINAKAFFPFFPTAKYSSKLSTLGKFEYLLNQNVALFKQYLKESVLIEQELFENFDQGKGVTASYVSLVGFWRLFEALASGDMGVAKGFAKHLGGRPEIEKAHSTPFQIDFGYTLKYFVENADLFLKKTYLEKLAADCKMKDYTAFSGYVTVFEAILEKNLEKAELGFKEIIKGHVQESRGRGERYFKGSEEEDICIWGIGLANLAIYYGLPVNIQDPLIPKELLLPSSGGT